MYGTLAIVSQSGQTLSFFDLKNGQRVAHLQDLVAEPHELCHDTKRNVLYVTHTYKYGHFWEHGERGKAISIVDCNKKEVVGTIDISPSAGPHGMALDKESDILYTCVETVSQDGQGGLIGIDLSSNKVVKRIESQYRSHWFVTTPGAKKAYTSNKTASFISVLDLETERMTGKIDVPGSEEPDISLDGKFAYFPTPGHTVGAPPPGAKILIIDTVSDKVVSSIPMEFGPQAAHITSKGQLMVAQYRYNLTSSDKGGESEPGLLTLFDTETHKPLGSVDIGRGPLTIRASEDGSLGFAANIFDGTVSVVDLTTMRVVQTLVIDQTTNHGKERLLGAHGLAFIP